MSFESFEKLAYRHTIYYPHRPPVAGVSAREYTNIRTYIDFTKALIDAYAYRLN